MTAAVVEPFIWKGKHLATIGELGDAMCAVRSRVEAQEFMAAYRAVNPYAAANIGYLAGYYDDETRRRVQDWFAAPHPIFGSLPEASGR